MTTSLFSQKNVCAALGLVMAITIVLKAKEETKLAHQTALIEYTKPTSNIGKVIGSNADEVFEPENTGDASEALRNL
ncbi:hypothetical protein PBT90_17625 [Algoriphagus halophytocola]|uniref:Uncharacterized protein n=1 Tax=Algoriphagus halophytocola TaxID=2991499 RepID=A0ABY6MG93_9BACT|nr:MULTISPECIES: hypothetical protein [unclassified Algoriphagus]UZD21341.1 hypothetical protein OM944_11760 [Algoriphagus sp. TR-M5]WBL42553.1 hypothetical protein PBT90_17625 [Algoriphagus sp. TR-M9]